MNFRDTQGQDFVLETAQGWRRHKRRLLYAGIAALVVLLLGVLLTRYLAASSSVSLSRLEVATVQQGPFVRDIAADGRVVAAVSPTLYAAAAGTVRYRVQAGDAVQKGAVLGIVDSPELTNRLAQEQAQLQSLQLGYENAHLDAQKKRLAARQKLEDARIDLKAAQTDLDRNTRAFQLGAVPQINVLRAQNALDKAQITLRHAEQDQQQDQSKRSFHKAAPTHCIVLQTLIAQHHKSARHGMHDRAPEVPALVDRIAGARNHIVALEPPGFIKVNESEVGVVADRDGSFRLTEPHQPRRRRRRNLRYSPKRHSSLVMAFGQQHRQKCLQPGTPRRRVPDAARLGRNLTMNVIGCDRIDVAGQQGLPQCLAIRRLAQRRIDFADISTGPRNIMRQIVRAGFDMNRGAAAAMTERRRQCFCRRGMNDVKRGSGDIRHISCALHGVCLDKRRPRPIPGSQTAGAVSILFLQTIAQNPGDLDRLRVRANHSAARRRRFTEAKQKPVIDIRQTKTRTLSAPIVHENLEARHAVIADVTRHAGELSLCRDNKVVAEIDTSAGLRDRNDIIEDFFKGLGRHQIRNKTGNAAFRGGRSLAIGIHGHARARNIAAVAEMKVNVDGTGENDEAACGNF